MVLSNISRPHHLAEKIFDQIESKISQLITAFTRTDYNKKKCHLNYLGEFQTIVIRFYDFMIVALLGPIFSNLSQVTRGREYFCQTDSETLSRLIPFVQYEASLVRKGGVVGLLKNICFDSSRHSYLLEEVGILPIILMSLAGPDEFTDEENDKFPMELQVINFKQSSSSEQIDTHFINNYISFISFS